MNNRFGKYSKALFLSITDIMLLNERGGTLLVLAISFGIAYMCIIEYQDRTGMSEHCMRLIT